MALRSLVFGLGLAACLPLATSIGADEVDPLTADLFSIVSDEPETQTSAADSVATPVERAVEPAAIEKTNEPELIQERYPNRAVKIERQVVQDASGNYVNHGPWKMYDERGQLLARGDYCYGQRQGAWTRWHLGAASEMLSQHPYKLFLQPFVSQATFDNGDLHGVWTIYDGKERKVSEFSFDRGERQGKWTWYYPNGQKMREIDYVNGYVDGHWMEWGANKNVTVNDVYQSGRKLARKTEKHQAGGPKSDGIYLFARDLTQDKYDWWNGQITSKVTGKDGKDQRHGAYTSWHKNGQKELEGRYVHDLPVGKFTWWYENGQKALEGEYDAGDQIGKWTWWHENGQKAIIGEYVRGTETGKWTWWNDDGKVANTARITERESQVAAGEVVEEHKPLVKAAPLKKPSHTARQPAVKKDARR